MRGALAGWSSGGEGGGGSLRRQKGFALWTPERGKGLFRQAFFYGFGKRALLVRLALFFWGKYGKGRTSFLGDGAENICLIILLYCSRNDPRKPAVGKKRLTGMRDFPR